MSETLFAEYPAAIPDAPYEERLKIFTELVNHAALAPVNGDLPCAATFFTQPSPNGSYRHSVAVTAVAFDRAAAHIHRQVEDDEPSHNDLFDPNELVPVDDADFDEKMLAVPKAESPINEEHRTTFADLVSLGITKRQQEAGGLRNDDPIFHALLFLLSKRGYQQDTPSLHAEQLALALAEAAGLSVEGGHLFSTMEPCVKDGMCTDTLAARGIARVWHLGDRRLLSDRGLVREYNDSAHDIAVKKGYPTEFRRFKNARLLERYARMFDGIVRDHSVQDWDDEGAITFDGELTRSAKPRA